MSLSDLVCCYFRHCRTLLTRHITCTCNRRHSLIRRSHWYITLRTVSFWQLIDLTGNKALLWSSLLTYTAYRYGITLLIKPLALPPAINISLTFTVSRLSRYLRLWAVQTTLNIFLSEDWSWLRRLRAFRRSPSIYHNRTRSIGKNARFSSSVLWLEISLLIVSFSAIVDSRGWRYTLLTYSHCRALRSEQQWVLFSIAEVGRSKRTVHSETGIVVIFAGALIVKFILFPSWVIMQ